MLKYLHSEIGKILGLDKTHNFYHNLGPATWDRRLANYASFEKSGFVLTEPF